MSVFCNICEKSQKVMKRCTRCNSVFYCSRECQVKDWPAHKPICAQNSAVKQTKIKTINRSKDEIVNDTPDCRIKSSQMIDFQKAFDTFQKPSTSDSVVSSGSQRSYLHCGKLCYDVPVLNKSDGTVCITVKASKRKDKLCLQTTWTAADMLKYISYSLQIPLDKLKLICKGRLLTAENIADFVKDKAVFQAIGEKAEDEVGVDSTDIGVLMTQLHIGRNEAVKTLKEKGDVIDAMLHLGNK